MTRYRRILWPVVALAVVAILLTIPRLLPGPVDKLTAASASGDLGAVTKLLNDGVLVEAWDREGKRALGRGAANGQLFVVRFLLEKGATPNGRSNYGKTALMSASSKGHYDVVLFLLASGADVNAKDDYNQTALICASRKGHLEIVRTLLEHGADINAKSRNGTTALNAAANYGHRAVVDLILEEGPALTVCQCQVSNPFYLKWRLPTMGVITENRSKRMKIEILGVGCAKCVKLHELVKKIVAANGIEAEVLKVEDIKEFAKYGVFMTPGLVIDGEVKVAGKVPKEAEILNWLK